VDLFSCGSLAGSGIIYVIHCLFKNSVAIVGTRFLVSSYGPFGIPRDDGDHRFDADAPPTLGLSTNSEHLTRALVAAAKHGWVDVMRFLTTRPIWHVTWTRALKQTDSPTASAARHGQLEALQFVHDRRVRKRARRNCASETVRSAMWESDNADVPRWLEWYGCEAYRPPRACDLISMIEQGRARMLAYAISKAPLAISEMRSAATEAAVRSAARAGHMETLRVVLGAGLCNRLSPVLAGAAAGCRTRIMEWVTTPPSDDPCLVGIEPVTVADARAAAVYAMTESTDPCSSIAFFIRRFGTDVADAGMLHVAVARSAIGCARLIESRAFEGDDDARRSFQWASLVPGALTVGSVDALRFLVEEKGARVEPHHIAACCPLSLDATAYLGARYSPSLFQVAIDIMGARIRLGTREAVRQLFERVPGLCASVADAVLSANGAPREPLCDCAKCTQHSTL
jgi:hypothetical protein